MTRETEQPEGAQPVQQEGQSELEQATAETDAPFPSTEGNDNWWRGAEGHSEVY